MDVSKEIIAKAIQGDKDAFEEIYRKSVDLVYGVSFRMTRNSEDAQEITQDVFLKVYKNLSSFEHRSSLRTWIYRITINATLTFRKKACSHKEISLDEIGVEKFSSSDKKFSTKAETEEVVDRMLSALNPDQKACMILRNLEGLSYEEIAQTLKININTVRTRLKRAREKLLSLRKEASYAM